MDIGTQQTFLSAKNEFDKTLGQEKSIEAFLPVNTTFQATQSIKSIKGEPNEEYYKWQFFYALIHSGSYQSDYIGAEVYFPKGNKNSAPIKFDGAIFDDPKWFDYYEKWQTKKDQSCLDWLRTHLIGVIEFKKEDSKDTETVYNQQLKPAMKESEAGYCLGILYDQERLYLFQKKDNRYYVRLDESFNLKGDTSSTKDQMLHLTDAYIKIPTFDQLLKRTFNIKIDRSKRTIDDLDVITGAFSQQVKDAISHIVRTMDKLSMNNQRGYEILIQVLALKIYDEKRSARIKSYLDFYKGDEEKEKLDLLFYIDDREKSFVSLADENIQSFISRMRTLYNEAAEEYHNILKRDDAETVNWKNETHVNVLSTVVEQLQDYSFVRSQKTDLYQLVFYKFSSEFAKFDKGQFITPIPLIDFLVEVVNPRSTEKVIDPTSGIADFLSVAYVNSQSKLDDHNIYGVDNDEQMIMLAQLNMLLNGDGNAVLKSKPDMGSILWKFDSQDNLVELQPNLHKNGQWDNWKDQTRLKKFDVVLTNPPFGEDRKYQPKNQREKEIIEMYELWHTARSGTWIDLGWVFLENAYRILKDSGRMGIVVSNSIASIDRWEKARSWLVENMRVVALFDLPPNVFADTGVNTTIIVAYKPTPEEKVKLDTRGYDVFVKDIKNVGYEVRTSKRVKFFNPVYKINPRTFEVEAGEDGKPLLDEDFTQTIADFRAWCLGQEKTLQELFIKDK